MTETIPEPDIGTVCRRIIRAAGRAALATTATRGKGGVGGPWPYTSLVLPACDHDISPLLLVSDLADHTRNLRADPRVSLLYDGTGDRAEPLTGPRLALQGEAEEVVDEALAGRYLRRQPSARIYAGFKDFHLFRIRPRRVHLVAGFGRIAWVEAGDILVDQAVAAAFAAAEPDLLDETEAAHPDLARLAATEMARQRGRKWRITGIDPDGFDLRREGRTARCDFASPAGDVAQARRNLMALARSLARG